MSANKTFTFMDDTGSRLFTYAWFPEDDQGVRGVVQIAHGMAETAIRYERFAKVLNDAGFIVYANDHRGHGKTAGSVEEVGYIGDDGYNWMVRNMNQLTNIIHAEHPGLPVILFGHSLGSFLTQQYIGTYGDAVQGAILSGSNGDPGPQLLLGIILAKREMKSKGERSRSATLSKLTFGSYNKGYEKPRTPFDWLSRDSEEVDKYIADEFCGGVFTASFYYHFFKGLRDTYKNKLAFRVPRHLPIYIFSGDADPVGRNGKGVRQLVRLYEEAGIEDLEWKLYPGGRHEMLNETNREEVMADIIAWLDAHVPRGK